ncbi:hypothetical protein BDAP_002226 [Binucleata daphniae]
MQWGMIKGIAKDKILEKLRKDKALKHVAMILSDKYEDLVNLIKKLREWEDLYFSGKEYKSWDDKDKFSYKQRTTCYQCNKVGHIAKFCKNNGDYKGSKSIIQLQDEDINKTERNYIDLNGRRCLCIFDSGSVTSIIGEENAHLYRRRIIVHELKNPKMYTLINGSKIQVNKEVKSKRYLMEISIF